MTTLTGHYQNKIIHTTIAQDCKLLDIDILNSTTAQGRSGLVLPVLLHIQKILINSS